MIVLKVLLYIVEDLKFLIKTNKQILMVFQFDLKTFNFKVGIRSSFFSIALWALH